MEEDFKARKSLHGGGFSNPHQGTKRRTEESRSLVPAKKAKIQYTAKEKAEYKKKKALERKEKKEGSVAPKKGEIKWTVWADAHPNIEQPAIDERKKKNESTRCGMDNHT